MRLVFFPPFSANCTPIPVLSGGLYEMINGFSPGRVSRQFQKSEDVAWLDRKGGDYVAAQVGKADVIWM